MQVQRRSPTGFFPPTSPASSILQEAIKTLSESIAALEGDDGDFGTRSYTSLVNKCEIKYSDQSHCYLNLQDIEIHHSQTHYLHLRSVKYLLVIVNLFLYQVA